MKHNIGKIITLLEEGRDNNCLTRKAKDTIDLAISWIWNNSK